MSIRVLEDSGWKRIAGMLYKGRPGLWYCEDSDDAIDFKHGEVIYPSFYVGQVLTLEDIETLKKICHEGSEVAAVPAHSFPLQRQGKKGK